MREPRRDHYIAPATDPHSCAVLGSALEQLAAARNLDATDAPTAVHLLASLSAEVEARFPRLIADARHSGCSWAEIADLLGVTRASAWQRWGRHAGDGGNETDRVASTREKRPRKG